MSDVLIRDVPDDVLTAIDARAAEMGLSRVEYIRRRLAQDARIVPVRVTPEDLSRLGVTLAALADEQFISEAWQ